MTKIGNYLLEKPMRANLVALVFMLLPLPIPGTAIAAVLLGLVTLQLGITHGAVMLAWVALPAIAAVLKWQLIASHYELAFIACVVTWLLATVFRASRGVWAKTAEAGAVIGLLYVLSLYLIPTPWLNYLKSALEQTTVNALSQLVSVDLLTIKNIVHSKALFLLGTLYFSLCFIAISYLVISRLWQLRLLKLNRQSVEFFSIQPCRFMGILGFLIIGSALIWRTDALEACAFIVSIPFLLGGFSLSLYACLRVARSGALRIVLIGLLITMLVIVPAVTLALMVLTGFVDIWVNFRKLEWLSSSMGLSSQHPLK